MPRTSSRSKKNKAKNKRQTHGNAIVICDDSSEENSDGEGVNNQVQQLQISGNMAGSSRMNQNQPTWGAGAEDLQAHMRTEHTGVRFESRERGNVPQQPPSVSGYLPFSESSLAPRSETFTNQMMSAHQTPGSSGASPMPFNMQNQARLMSPQLRMPFGTISLRTGSPLVAQMMQTPIRSTPDLLQPRRIGHCPMPDVRTPNVQSLVTPNMNMSPLVAPEIKTTGSEFPKATVKNGPPPGTKIRDREPISIMKHHGRGRLNVEEVNSSIQECIEVLSRAGEHVSLERLEAMILEKYEMRQFTQLNLNIRNFNQMPAANEHSRLLSKVNNYAHSFARARSMCTLYELGECLRDIHKDKLEFDKFELGPLQAMPVVYELFKFPVDEYIPEITSIDIIEHLNGYLDSSQNWTNKVQLDDFLEYLQTVYQVQTPFSLGVRLRSMPLAIQSLKTSKRHAGQSRRTMLESLKIILTDDITKAFQRFRDNIFQSGKDGCPELKLHYANLKPLEAVNEIYLKFELLAALIEGEGTPMLQHRLKKFHTGFSAFRKSLEGEPLARQLFHLAVCLSVTDVEESAMAFLEEQRQPRRNQMVEAESDVPKKDKPSQSTVADKIINYINRCLQEGNLLLSHLRRIEEKVVETFEFTSFAALGHGAFLLFLLSNPKIKEILDDCGGAMIGSTSSGVDGARCFHPSYFDLKELMCQVKQAGVTQITQVASIVCEQFGVTEVKTLGHGSIARLAHAAESPGKHSAPQYNCYFEAALCGKACPSTQATQSVGCLGYQSREKALAVLTSCPLLEDMNSWSHWSLVFQPEHGNLKDFVARYGGRQVHTISGGKQEAISDFMALEIEPGKLLKINSQSTASSFNLALERGDPLLAAGELASLIASSKGVESSPLALLANHVTTKLLSLRAQQGVLMSPGSNQGIDPKVLFVVTIMMRLPIRLCAAVANQVLLGPLSQVVGSAKSKMAIIQACQVPWQKERLETLGILLGIPEWTVSLKDKMTFPSHLVQNVVGDELFGQSLEEEGDKQEEEDESLVVSDDDDDEEEEDDIDDILSDEEEKFHDAKAIIEEEKTSSDARNEDKGEETVKENEDKKEQCKNVMPDDSEEDMKEEKEEEEESEDVCAETTKETGEDDGQEAKVEEGSGDGLAPETVKEEESKPLTREEACHRVIDTIRREEFGVGIELTEEASKLMKTQQERQGRSLSRLSKDLYSKDTHFVLELIQNADDNPYSADVLPALQFVIDGCGVTIQNNELGFEENNIRALCDVGKSTKSKHQLGYIGQKGIGFKSVFRVTERPEVHSNGFRICFDVNSGPMGYIMPHWMEETMAKDEKWQTQILLPWTDRIKDQIVTHAARFNDIQPSLLLFLHRLREITISNKVEGCEIKMSRKDLPTGEIQISHSHGLDRWLVVRKVLDAAQVSIEAKSGVEVLSTEIALAFPLRDKGNMLTYGARLGQLPVFAFLPLQSYGFRFIVQGDFNVPSSREAIDKDSSWNQWLRDQIPSLFIEAWDSFLNLPDFSAMDAFISYLQFIPLEGEIMSFFSPVTSVIRSQLMAKDCMPVMGASGKKDEILWKAPSKTVMTQSSLVREIISPQLLLHNLGLYYLHWDVLETVGQGVLQALGVDSISTEHLLLIGQGVAGHWDGAGSPDQVTELAKWMACIYCSLDHFKENMDVFNRLREMRIIPLSDGSLVSLEDTTVFLLTDDHRPQGGNYSTKSKRAKATKDPLQALRQDVNIIHPDLTSTHDAEVNSQVSKLLSRLDIKQMTPHDLIHSHVLPALSSDLWKDKSNEVLISYLVCAKEVLCDSTEDMARLKEVARVVTNHGVKQPSQDSVHFSTEYGNEVNLERIFPMLSWTLLQPAYLPQNATELDKRSWHRFFSQLGVEDFLCVSKTEVCLDKTRLLNSPWVANKDLWQDLPEEFVIEDFSCEEFYSLITRSDVQFQTVCQLFELLDKHWDALYKKFTVAKLVSKSGEVLKDKIDSSFAVHLKTHAWVPAFWTTTSNSDTRPVKESGLLAPCQLYCRQSEVEKLLAHTAKYLAVKPNDKSSFTHFLQIKSSVQKEAVKEALVSWGQRAEGKPNTPAVFTTTVKHMLDVYNYLQRVFSAGEIQNLFHEHPVVFIAQRESGTDIVTGQMMRREEMWWSDVCGLFTKYRDSLEKYNHSLARFRFMLPFYQGYDELFQIARIDKTHNMLHLAQLLKHITEVFTLEDEGVLHDILSLFSGIGLALSKAEETLAGVRTQEAQVALDLRGKVKTFLSDCTVFPSMAKSLVGLRDQPMIADSKEWEKMFENKPLVHFLLLESPQAHSRGQHTPQRHGRGGNQAPSQVDPDDIQYFLELFPEEILPLSSCVIWEEITSGFKPCARGQKYLHDIVGLLQQFLYFSFPNVYNEFKANNADQLRELIFTEVDRLEVKYELKGRPDVFEIRTENCIIKGNHFYFLAKNIENQSEINKEVAKFFSNGDEKCIRDIRNFLSQAVPILEGKIHESIEDLLARQEHRIDNLPEEEEAWEVPLPVIPVYDPPPPTEPEPAMYEGQGDASSHGLSNTFINQDDQDQDVSGKSWPPQSGVDFEVNPALLRKGAKKTQSKFAPPEAPDYIKACRVIPASIRFENEPEEKVSGEKSEESGQFGQQLPSIVPSVSKSNEPRSSSKGDKEEREDRDKKEAPKGASGNSSKERVDRPRTQEEGDGDIIQMRGKRKLITDGNSVSSDEGESRTPASKRQSLESKKDETSQEAEKQAQQKQTTKKEESKGERTAHHRRMLHFNIPIWNDVANSVAYTELTSDLSKITLPHELGDNAQSLEIGRWGERLVYDYLKQQRESNASIEDIIWANLEDEKGLPYDFEMICKTEEGGSSVYSVFIEVKATRTDDKELFEISSGQVQFAMEQQERYQIFRVYGAGKDSLRLVRVDNIADRMKTKGVRLLMVI